MNAFNVFVYLLLAVGCTWSLVLWDLRTHHVSIPTLVSRSEQLSQQEQLYTKQWQASRTTNNLFECKTALSALAMIYWQEKKFPEAIAALQDNIALEQNLEQRLRLSESLAAVQRDEGTLSSAASVLNSVLQERTKLSDRCGLQRVVHNLTVVKQLRRDVN